MTKRIFPAFLLFAFIALKGFSQTSAPKYSNEFLSIGLGARALGMGGAQSAIVNDVTSGFWNPAGLCLSTGDLQIGLMHNEYFAGIGKFDYGAVAAKYDSSRYVGLSIIRFGIDDIPNTLELINEDGQIDYDRLKSFSSADYAFIFSYSKNTKIAGFRYGGNFKIIHRKVGDFAKAWGFGLDAGAQYDYKNWKFGAFGKDLTSTFNAWSFNTTDLEKVYEQTGNELPQNGLEITLPKLILGIGYRAQISSKFSLLPSMDIDVTFDGKRNVLIQSSPVSADPHFGLEAGYDDFIFLRGGVTNIQSELNPDGTESTIIQPSIGIGIKIKNLTLDYALTNAFSSSPALYSNVFSLKLNIFKQQKRTG